jgi:hypothetical protein
MEVSMLDILEQMEAAAERRYNEMYVDKDHYRCACGKVTNNDEMNFLSPNPYSAPVCDDCFEKYMEEKMGNER